MDFAHSARATEYLDRVGEFIATEIDPVEPDHHRELAALDDPWVVLPVIEELKAKAKAKGLWNLFLPDTEHGAGLKNVEYAPLAELMGRSAIAPEVFNCNAPDTGNMEVLHMFGSQEQKDRWLTPLLAGEIRSAFCMTEPDVASSDATNMAATAVVDGDEIVLNGTKWFSTGIGHPNCKVAIFMGLTDPDAHKYARHSMVLVPLDTPGVTVGRMLPVFGRLDAPSGHGEVTFTDVRLPLEAVIAGPGRGFEIAQGRLGPGRIHHCMRLIGLAEKALELACRRATDRVAFGKPLANLGGNRERIANARIAIDQARLLVLSTAWKLDTHGLRGALSEVSQIKMVVPNMALGVIDMAIQLHGGAGMTDDFPLAAAYAGARALRLADGPDEVHQGVVSRIELKKYLP
ncbi:acyl-CoA dehydrogenase family protein [Actinokineospora spheciospongiae]|uniref:acyl-CoA dehydrogenase family protein n=1 Tax=Actinokineospora spheciospongiae TaxID=909613 RepID=UPI000D71559E|nr:acyl-CoA dehydrogenase family protein [Actinokineospora spheciospongiae]PWW56224.1 alkylation response protein AidB-like acyl-CoA dehydrogenase [Actinokineospora spheciospongiae]